ncbi:unnamed protein product [Effrenium voratum]|nr:unnamed protein product [Effrenium voratum]
MSQTVQYNGKLFQRKALAATQMAKDMLDLGDPISRRLATGALSQLGQAEALQHCQDFVAALKDQDRGVRYCAMVYLCFARSFSGPSPVQEYTAEVAELLEDEDPGIRFWAIETLGNQGIASVPQSAQLQRALQDNDPHCRLAAAKAVVRVCPEYMAEAAEILVRAMDPEEDKIFRRSGAEGLGYMGDKALKYLPQLIDALGDCYPPARAAAAKSLGELGAEAVLQAASDLARSLDDNDLEVRAAAAKALQRLDITEALLSSEPRLRRWGLEMATEGKEQRHGQALAQLLGDQQDVIRFWAAQALCALGAPACDFPEELNRAVQAQKFPRGRPPALYGDGGNHSLIFNEWDLG